MRQRQPLRKGDRDSRCVRNWGNFTMRPCLGCSMRTLLVESLHSPVRRCIARLAYWVGSVLTQTVQLKSILGNLHPFDQSIPHDVQQGETSRTSKRVDRFAARVNDKQRAPTGEGRSTGKQRLHVCYCLLCSDEKISLQAESSDVRGTRVVATIHDVHAIQDLLASDEFDPLGHGIGTGRVFKCKISHGHLK
jgi:hypothetical protein